MHHVHAVAEEAKRGRERSAGTGVTDGLRCHMAAGTDSGSSAGTVALNGRVLSPAPKDTVNDVQSSFTLPAPCSGDKNALGRKTVRFRDQRDRSQLVIGFKNGKWILRWEGWEVWLARMIRNS